MRSGLLRCPPFVRFICGRMWCRKVLPATLSPALWVYLCKCGAAGSASARTACPFGPTLHQSRSHHGHVSPLHPGARLCPSYRSGCMFLFLFPWCRTSLPFDFLSVLVVRGGAVCLPTPPSWSKSQMSLFFILCGWIPSGQTLYTCKHEYVFVSPSC